MGIKYLLVQVTSQEKRKNSKVVRRGKCILSWPVRNTEIYRGLLEQKIKHFQNIRNIVQPN